MKKEIMYCRNCGKPVPTDAKFCQHCGTAVLESQTQPPAQPKQKGKPARPEGNPRKKFVIAIIAILVITAICSPITLLGRNYVLDTPLNPENRASAQPASAADGNRVTGNPVGSDSSSPEPTWTTPPTLEQQAPENTPVSEEIKVRLIEGNATGFSQPPERIAYADDQAGNTPSWIQLAPFCKAGCFRYKGWLGLINPGDSYEILFIEPTDSIGVQFWGDPGDGIAYVYLDNQLVWEGDTEGTDANYPGGAFVKYLQISNLPKIENHILRIETDQAGGAVTMYFFGSGEVIQ